MSEDNDAKKCNDLPKEIAARHKDWEWGFRIGAAGHFYLGVFSVLASSVAAITVPDYPIVARVCAGIATVLTATIGFLKPQHGYLMYIRAWRVLDLAAMRYRAGLINDDDLIKAVGEGEAIIAKMETNLMNQPTTGESETFSQKQPHGSDKHGPPH